MIAHELAHIKNRDILTMTVAATVAGAISMLAQFGFFFGGGRDRDSGMGPIGMLLAVIFAPLAAMLIQMTISRTREYSADKLGAEISGDPLGLASALRKISGYAAPHPDAERRAQPGLGAALHHQPALRPAHGQPVLDPPERREPHPRARGDGRGRRRRARSAGRSQAEPDPDRPPPVSAAGLGPRRAAAALLAGVLVHGRTLADQTGAGGPLAALAPPERARAKALAAGTLRHLGRIDAVLAASSPAGRRRRR